MSTSSKKYAAFVESSYTGAGRHCIDWCLEHDVPPVFFTRDTAPYPFLSEIGDRIRTVICDTTSAEAIFQAAKALPGDAHFATTDDYSVAVVAELRRRQGHATSSPSDVSVCRDKRALRRKLQEFATWSNPSFAEIDDANIPVDFRFPAVIKPASYTGSIGVRLCSSVEDARSHIREFASLVPPGSAGGSTWLLEEVLQGQEYSIECMNGQIAGFTRKSKFDPPWFIEKGHLFPAPIDTEQQAHASEQLKAILQSLGLTQGPLHVEAYVDPQGVLRIVEINARLGGGRIPQLVKLAGGADLVDRCMAWVMGNPIQDTMPSPNSFAAIRFDASPELVTAAQTDPAINVIEAEPRTSSFPKERRSNLDRQGRIIATSAHAGALELLFSDPPRPAPKLLLRRAQNSQIAQITRLHLAGLVDSGSLSLDPTLDADLIDVESSYADGFFVVAAFESAPEFIVGMGAIRPLNDEWHVKRMRVDAAHRRVGIAQAVLDCLIAEARKRGVTALVLDTSLKQEAAQRLYERNGFVHTGDASIGGISSRLYLLTLV